MLLGVKASENSNCLELISRISKKTMIISAMESVDQESGYYLSTHADIRDQLSNWKREGLLLVPEQQFKHETYFHISFRAYKQQLGLEINATASTIYEQVVIVSLLSQFGHSLVIVLYVSKLNWQWNCKFCNGLI